MDAFRFSVRWINLLSINFLIYLLNKNKFMGVSKISLLDPFFLYWYKGVYNFVYSLDSIEITKLFMSYVSWFSLIDQSLINDKMCFVTTFVTL